MTRTAVVKLARLLCAQGYGVRVRRHAPARRPAYYTVARLQALLSYFSDLYMCSPRSRPDRRHSGRRFGWRRG
jgi:hypothetical protein